MATRIWNSSGSTDMNDSGNYTGTGALLSTDDLVFNNTSTVNATATADLNVASITTTSAYSGEWSVSGRIVTLSGNATFDGTGTLNLGNGFTLNGASATFLLGAGVGTVTSLSCVLTMNGTEGMVYTDNKGITIKQLILGIGAIVTRNGTAGNTSFITSTVGLAPLVMNDNSTFTLNQNSEITVNQPAPFFTLGSNVTFNGTGILKCYNQSNGISNVPAFTRTTGDMHFCAGIAGGVINFTGNINMVNRSLRSYGSIANAAITINYGASGNDIIVTCKDLYFGVNVSGANNPTVNCNNTTFNVVNFGSYNTSAHTVNLQSSTWNLTGNWNSVSNINLNPGSSLIKFITNNHSVTSKGKPFYNLILDSPSKTISFLDAMTCNNLQIKPLTTAQFQSGTTVTISTYNSGDWNGTNGSVVTIKSSTPSSAFTLANPTGMSISYINATDSNANNTISYDSTSTITRCTNWTLVKNTSLPPIVNYYNPLLRQFYINQYKNIRKALKAYGINI